MQGALVDTPPADLFVRLAGQSATGTLTLSGPDGDGEVRFVHGAVAGARAPGDRRSRGLRLGERLVHAGRLEADDLDRVLTDQAATASPVALGHLLVERGLVPADVARLLLQEQALEALGRLLDWRGTYAFEVDPAPAARLGVGLPVDRALAEIRRRERERDRVRTLVPSPTAIPRTTSADPSTTRLSPDAVSVLTAVDGRVSVGAIASTLGYGYDEASRITYRLVLQGLLEVEAANGHAPPPRPPQSAVPVAQAEPSVPSAPSGPEPAARAEVATDRPAASTFAQASPPDDDGFEDEPRPWIGWAQGTPDTSTETGPAADEETAGGQPAAEAEQPTTGAGPEDRLFTGTPSSSHDVDETTRRELFSELHAVSRAEAEPRPAPRPTAPAEPAEPEPEPPVDEEPEPEPEVPTERAPVSDLSGDELSSLLRELHDLNRDDEAG